MVGPNKSMRKRKTMGVLKPKKTAIQKGKFKDVVQSEGAAARSQIEDEVPDFPRGGGKLLSRKEEEEVRAEVDAEYEVEQRMPTKNKRKRKGGNFTAEEDLGSLFGKGITGKLPRFANRITLKNVSPGMKLWGVVTEVNKKDLVVGLPGGLRGLVRANEASDLLWDNEIKDLESTFLSKAFYVGKLVSCIVLQVDDDKNEGKGRRKIWLTLRLALLHKSLALDVVQEGMVLTSYVKSIEDHGYIVNFGLPSFTGFLPRRRKDGDEIKMVAGQLLQGVVESIDKIRRVIHFSSDPAVASKCVMKDLKGVSIDLLLPGMLVNARVQAILENGVMLTFLTYFTGTVDSFHLHNSLPTKTWKDDYNQNKKVNARILFIDPSTRAVGLTLNPHLVRNQAPPSHVKMGEIYENSRIVRVDRGFGLLLEIPSAPVPTPGYVTISDVADDETGKLEKKFKEGNHVRVRVFGFKHLEGLAMGVLKASAFEGPVFTHSDVKPGMVVKAKVISVSSFGAIVQFSSGVKALCPLRHMSELDIAKPRKKFKVGAELAFRVLGCKSKRITVTHKKTLVKSKLPILSSFADATEGLITHGWIAKVEENGCVLRFYNGVVGVVPSSELGLDPGYKAASMYHVGQVVKCRVLSAVPSSRKISLSLITSPKRGSVEDSVKLGSLVSGIYERPIAKGVVVNLNRYGCLKGIISDEHLADFSAQAAVLKSSLKPGYEFKELLVLDVEGKNLVLSAKHSLIFSNKQIPKDVAEVQPHSVVHGYICNIIEGGCFVRYLGQLTGFTPKHKALDDPRDDIFESFHVGQSVRSNVLNVDSETGRMSLSLKQSKCFSIDASLIQGYFLSEEKISEMRTVGMESSGFKWVDKFTIGSFVEGVVHEIKDSGIVLRFKDHDEVFGFISNYHVTGLKVELGSVVKSMVLDIDKTNCRVDLSLKEELTASMTNDPTGPNSEKRGTSRGNLVVHQTVNAIVELVQENYVVLSVPEFNHVIGYASKVDYNTQKLPHKNFLDGQSVFATVVALPSPSTSGRLLLLLKSLSEDINTSSSKRAKRKSSYEVGSLVDGEITDIRPLEMRLQFSSGFHGRVYITEATDDYGIDGPFNKFKIGQRLTARIIGMIVKPEKSRKHCEWELSIKPTMISGYTEEEDMSTKCNYSVGASITGYVVKVNAGWIWLAVSRHVKAELFYLDSSTEPNELQDFSKRFPVGKSVTGQILRVNQEKKLLRLILRPFSAISKIISENNSNIVDDSVNAEIGNVSEHIREGDVIGGRIAKVLPGVGGLLVQIGPHLFGKVHFVELVDKWVDNPLSDFHVRQFVKCKVLEISQPATGVKHFDLSLRGLSENIQDDHISKVDGNQTSFGKTVEAIEDLQSNMTIQGYVKSVTPKGCFIMLSRKIDAKVLLSNLSDGFIEQPEKEFPVGKLVHGRVLSVEPLSRRVEVTFRSETSSSASVCKSDSGDFCDLHVGDIVSGRIKRVERYGLFITIDPTNMVGLCHVSELSDDRIENIESKFKASQRIVAKILKASALKQTFYDGTKAWYFMVNTHLLPTHFFPSGKEVRSHVSFFFMAFNSSKTASLHLGTSRASCIDLGSSSSIILVEKALKSVGERAVVPWTSVELQEIFGTCRTFSNVRDGDIIIEPFPTIEGKYLFELKKKRQYVSEGRRLAILACLNRKLQKDVPKSADDFEKLVRGSPNSSLVWIKYMAFMLSMADVMKARSIAERALRTINIREENEKLNVWKAYFNLENEYGDPREEAIKKVFQRALQYSDPKKIHFALLTIYEGKEQHAMADELLDQMVKKFKNSCKIWLRRIENLLKQKKDGVESVVKRATICLPRHKHIKFISKTAILMFKCGMPDRGRSMFEEVLREYPKRTDLWSIYLDQEIRLGDENMIRGLFERATSLTLPSKKIKFLFTKFLVYEKSHGDEERVEYVKRKAMDHVKSKQCVP
ncbi:hypothetical protein Sjap_026418 [Stephania japonica]|uniref:Protein RRP5 homolog n=1 Tax=Stephania japonica TaxID=461633 RepID=A0AAP0HIG9_9MAGN